MDFMEHEEKGSERANEVNRTGIPDGLLRRAQEKAGMSLSDVRVQYNSPMPSRVGALAYTQGSQIYVAPGQERHLPHELGHVVQQKKGRVMPTMTVNGFPVNDDQRLEEEADRFL